jgi:transposase
MPKTTLPRKTWQYTKEFKIKAVKLTLLYDYKVKDVANSLGIHRCMLSRWRKEFREGILHGDDKLRLDMPTKKKVISPKKLTDIDKLRQANEKLKKENYLLKKWQQYLAEQHQNDLDSSIDSEKS